MGCSPLVSMNPAEFLIDLANGNVKDKSIPSDLEDKFLPRNKTLHMKHEEPSQDDVHEVIVNIELISFIYFFKPYYIQLKVNSNFYPLHCSIWQKPMQ